MGRHPRKKPRALKNSLCKNKYNTRIQRHHSYNQSINHNPSSSSLIPSNILTDNEAREAPKDDDDDDDDDDNDNLPPKLRPFNPRFTFVLAGVRIPNSSVSTLTTTLLRASSF
jgi:hypothetical protein